jgi:hypothetical protein
MSNKYKLTKSIHEVGFFSFTVVLVIFIFLHSSFERFEKHFDFHRTLWEIAKMTIPPWALTL